MRQTTKVAPADPSATPMQRADALLRTMTMEEKAMFPNAEVLLLHPYRSRPLKGSKVTTPYWSMLLTLLQ